MQNDEVLIPAFPEDWQTALAIVAHPDDLEYGAASAIARWTSQGKTVVYVMVSRGEAGMNDRHPSEVGPLRSQEEINAARAVGVNAVEFLEHPDGVIEYGLPLRRDISRAIRSHRPDVILTLSHHLQFPSGHLNQSDHRHVGIAVFDAARDAANQWVFPELLNQGLEPWDGVRFVAVFGPNEPTHGIDVTGFWEQGLESLRQHRAYLEYMGDESTEKTFRFLTAHAVEAGNAIGCEHAVTVELVLINEPFAD
jgi:LmbE family N-acetylglucosaminyl deacetylase